MRPLRAADLCELAKLSRQPSERGGVELEVTVLVAPEPAIGVVQAGSAEAGSFGL